MSEVRAWDGWSDPLSWTGRKESGGPVPGRTSENPSSLSAQKRRAGGLRGWSVGVGFCLNFSRVLEVRPPGHYRPAGPRGPGDRGITQRHTIGRRHLRFKPTLILLLELKGISRSLLFREDGKETFFVTKSKRNLFMVAVDVKVLGYENNML